MEKLYYVEVTVSGSIAISSDVAASEDEAREMVEAAISGEKKDAEIMESTGDMLRPGLHNGEADVGDTFTSDD